MKLLTTPLNIHSKAEHQPFSNLKKDKSAILKEVRQNVELTKCDFLEPGDYEEAYGSQESIIATFYARKIAGKYGFEINRGIIFPNPEVLEKIMEREHGYFGCILDSSFLKIENCLVVEIDGTVRRCTTAGGEVLSK